MSSGFWDERYGADEYAYGTEPNDFLRAEVHHLPKGDVLCLAEGEGRNAVFLAELGYRVTALDQSMKGLEKAARLAETRGVALELVQADLSTWTFPAARYTGVVSIFGHLPPPVRQRVLAGVASALVPGGVFVTELYRPEQLALGTGGPRDVSMMPALETLTRELDGFELVIARAVDREIREGRHHHGPSATVQVVARKP
ncbi:class I SAM-dependent methyltransferase [Myxococcota bacterium]|nr:class I SAM-dependent methyltransferase [Myxococcota bacterium]